MDEIINIIPNIYMKAMFEERVMYVSKKGRYIFNIQEQEVICMFFFVLLENKNDEVEMKADAIKCCDNLSI